MKKKVNFKLPDIEDEEASETKTLYPPTREDITSPLGSSDEFSEKSAVDDYAPEHHPKQELYYVELPKHQRTQEDLDLITFEQRMTLCLLTLTNIIFIEVHSIEQLRMLYHCKTYFYKKLNDNDSSFTASELNTLFYRLNEIVQTVEYYNRNLSQLLKKWSNDIGLSLAYKDTLNSMSLYHDYVDNFKNIEKLIESKGGTNAINKFVRKEIPNIDVPFTDLIQLPVIMRSRIIYGLKQLVKYIPPSKRDYMEMRLAVQFAMAVNGVREPFGDVIGHPLKCGYAVQVVSNRRLLRYLFLFPNNLIITSLKKNGTQSFFFECIDVIRLGKHMTNVVKSVNSSDQMWPEVQKTLQSWKTLKHKLNKFVKRREIVFGPWYLMKVKLFERLIYRKEITLILLIPSLRLSVQDVINQNVYHFLFSSICELESWKDIIEENNYPYSELSVLLNYVENFCQIPKMTLQKYISKPFSYLRGVLEVYVHQVRDLETDTESFITLQVDSFDGYFNKIYTTRISESSSSPIFDEMFNIPLSCSQNLKICFYKKDSKDKEFELFSTGVFDFWKESLTTNYRMVTIPLYMQNTLKEKIIPDIDITNPLGSLYLHKPQEKTVVALTLRLISAAESSTAKEFKLFGQSIKETIAREEVPIPLIITSCIREIEKRGLDMETLYIIKGNSLNVGQLFQEFENSPVRAAELIKKKQYTVHDIAELLLWYLNALPTSPLQYPESFIFLHDIQNETRKEIALRSLIRQLSTEERRVLFYILDHFVKVCKHAGNRITTSTVGMILCSVFYDLEYSEKTEEFKEQEEKFGRVMEYIVTLIMKGVALYAN